jgi:hypothetical protein
MQVKITVSENDFSFTLKTVNEEEYKEVHNVYEEFGV